MSSTSIDRSLRGLPFLIMLLATVMFPQVVSAQTSALEFAIVDLGTLDGGEGCANDINNIGQIVGISGRHGFLWQNGVTTDLGTLGPGAINDRGQVVGTSRASGIERAFLWENGVMTDLGTLPAQTISEALDINNRGQIVGRSWTPPSGDDPNPRVELHFFLWEAGVMRDLGTLGPLGSTGVFHTEINNRGQILLVRSGSVDGEHFFLSALWERGVLTELGDFLGSGINDRAQIVGISPVIWEKGEIRNLRLPSGSNPTDINNLRQIVGATGTGPMRRAFLWDKGTVTDLGTIAGPRSAAFAINEPGQIVGCSTIAPDQPGFGHPVLWTRARPSDYI